MQPLLFWIFGANTAGKTTNAQQLNGGVEHFNLDKIIMDLVDKDMPGFIKRLINSSEESRLHLQDEFIIHYSNNAEEGNAEFDNRCSEKIKTQENFSVESNYLPSRNNVIVNKAINEGYKLSITYLAVQSIDILVSRVEQRTQLTGQYVSVEEIERRYKGGKTDINELLSRPTKFAYKDASQEILLISATGYELNIILHIDNWKLKSYDKSLCKEFMEDIPNISMWIG